MARSWLFGVFVVGCYSAHPTFEQPCTASGACPAGQMCIADKCVQDGTSDPDASISDALADARVDARFDAKPDAMTPAIMFESITDASLLQATPAMGVTVAHPACAIGNVMVATIAMGNTGQPAPPVFTPPTGWTLVRRSDRGNDSSLLVYWHTAAAAEPNSYTWQFSALIEGVAWIACYANVDPTTPIDVESGGLIATTGPGYAAPTITPTRARTMLVVTYVSHAPTSAGTTWLPPALTNQRVNLNNTTTRSGTTADRLLVTANPTGTQTAIASEVQDYALVESLALRPAP